MGFRERESAAEPKGWDRGHYEESGKKSVCVGGWGTADKNHRVCNGKQFGGFPEVWEIPMKSSEEDGHH